MKRMFDIVAAIFLSIILFVLFLCIFIIVRATSKGPVIFWSDRVGLNSKIFKMPKFRSMLVGAPDVATHLLENPEMFLTPVGGWLRKYSLDELPQIYSVLKGDMSFVGPRPALFNQNNLISLRKEKGVDTLLPGITGWAQVNGRDKLSIQDKVALDVEYLKRQSFWLDVKILFMTLAITFKHSGILH